MQYSWQAVRPPIVLRGAAPGASELTSVKRKHDCHLNLNQQHNGQLTFSIHLHIFQRENESRATFILNPLTAPRVSGSFQILARFYTSHSSSTTAIPYRLLWLFATVALLVRPYCMMILYS